MCCGVAAIANGYVAGYVDRVQSVDDVERISQRTVARRPCDLVEVADRPVVEHIDRHGDHIVAV